MTYHAKVIAGGKVVIPADIRRELGIPGIDAGQCLVRIACGPPMAGHVLETAHHPAGRHSI